MLGIGGQGSVLAVKHKLTGRMAALKIVIKDTLSPSGVRHVLTEQTSMKETIGNGFFPQLLASFETKEAFCLLSVRLHSLLRAVFCDQRLNVVVGQALCSGGSLRDKVSREGCLELYDAKLIVAQIVCVPSILDLLAVVTDYMPRSSH